MFKGYCESAAMWVRSEWHKWKTRENGAHIGWTDVVVAIIIFSLAVSVVASVLRDRKYRDLRDKLVENGYAEYYIDDDHQAQWRLIKGSKQKENDER